jgi:hypothetical protein
MEEKKKELREKLGECYSISTKNETLSLFYQILGGRNDNIITRR